MKRIIRFIAGYRRFKAERKYSAELVNICKSFGFVYSDTAFDGEYMFFSCSLRTAKRLEKVCSERNIEIFAVSESGVPKLFRKYRHRYGIAAGILAFAAIVFFSGRVIWDIRVEGNEKLSDAEVIEQLRENGLSVGDVKSGIDTGSVENRVMIASDDISWISVNIIGTVAEVEIRETEVKEEKIEYAASNIVAAKDGQIELFENVRGNVLLKIGDFVRRGELIVSGLYDSQTQGVRYTAAKGRVLARTENEIEVEIPFKYDKKVYTGRIFTEKYLVFFEKEIKFYGNSGNSYASCDKIDTVEYLDIFSEGELPLGIRTIRYLEYTCEESERGETEAERLAVYKLERELAALAEETELLGKSTEAEITDTAYIIRCRVECIENIAQIKEIKIKGITS
ncbi:MAG: sporulation protein YqfD [Clostridia bacterium]|nr:sporulation protein YqfD [Clostridia bacterium]